MTTVNVSLTEEMRTFVESRMTHDGFASADEFLLSLLREEQRRQAKRELDAKILEGLESGPAEEITPDFWVKLRQRALEGLAGETIRP